MKCRFCESDAASVFCDELCRKLFVNMTTQEKAPAGSTLRFTTGDKYDWEHKNHLPAVDLDRILAPRSRGERCRCFARAADGEIADANNRHAGLPSARPHAQSRHGTIDRTQRG